MIDELRSGFTTGACVAGGAYAGLNYLLNNNISEDVTIMSGDGYELKIPVESLKKGKNWARAVIIKDAGDDPDVTNGIKICVKVKMVDSLPEDSKGFKYDNILLRGGKGVGVVTKKGLKVEIGKYAINPYPQKMIVESIKGLTKDLKGVVVTVYVPEGKEKAKKTFNEKLGVIGGISILGTTGIVKPMSEESLKASMFAELKVMRENSDKDWAIFVFGNHGKNFCIENSLDLEQMIVTSNYMGFMIDSAVKLGYKNILLIGHIGKAIKISGGIFNTHSRVADARLEIFGANAIIVGEKRENILKILSSNTAEEAIEYVEKKDELFKLLAEKMVTKCEEYSRASIKFEGGFFDYSGKLLGYSKNFYQMIERIKNG